MTPGCGTSTDVLIPREWQRRAGQAFAELRNAPLARALVFGGMVAAAGRVTRSRSREAAMLGLSVGIVERSLSKKSHLLGRVLRNAEDAALLAGHLGPDLPPLGTWAVEPDFARLMVQELESRPEVVVELGSGTSSLLLASALHRRGFGQLISIDDNPDFAANTRERLARAGVADRVDVVVAALRRQTIGSVEMDWYDVPAVLGSLPPSPINLLIIDGPPSTSKWARWPAIEILGPRLARGATVLLDDGRRRRESATTFRWIRDHANLDPYWLDTVKGTWRLENRVRSRESTAIRALRGVWRACNPHPAGFGRWAVRR